MNIQVSKLSSINLFLNKQMTIKTLHFIVIQSYNEITLGSKSTHKTISICSFCRWALQIPKFQFYQHQISHSHRHKMKVLRSSRVISANQLAISNHRITRISLKMMISQSNKMSRMIMRRLTEKEKILLDRQHHGMTKKSSNFSADQSHKIINATNKQSKRLIC